MRSIVILAVLGVLPSLAQFWGVKNHPNNRKKAVVARDVVISDYVYTEVGDLSEGKAYVAQGELYAYIDERGKELSPYIFTVVSNFTGGYAIIGDSLAMSVINEHMQLIVPLQFQRVKLPVCGLIAVQSFEGSWGVYDVLGNLRLPFIFDLPPHILSRDKIIVRQNEEYGVVNDCNEYIFNCAYQYITPNGYGYKSGKYLRLF
jgi:hypothetical protein